MLSLFPSLPHYYHTPKLFSPNRTSPFSSVNPKTSSYTSPKATAKSPSSKQHDKPPRKPLLEPSFLEVSLNACEDFIDTFINPLHHPSVDPKCVLADNFAPVDELPPTECEVVKGKLPPCLDGAYIRNGPNPQYLPRGPFHLFDGDGMLHSTRISQGKAIFCSRYVQTYKYLVDKEARFSVVPNPFSDFNGLMASVSRGAVSIARTILGQFDPRNGIGRANTSLALFGGNLFALYEADLPYAIKLAPDGDIITIGRHDFDGNLSTTMTAHPKIDPNTNEAFALRYGPIPPFLTYFRIDPNGTKSRGVPIFSMTRPSFVHDFAITKNYAIFPDIQIEVGPFALITCGSPLGSDSRKVPRLGVIPRYATDESEMKWFEVPGFNMIHAINAWEEDDGDTIVVIGTNIISVEHFFERWDLIHTSIEKVKIDLKTGAVSRHPVSTRNLELAVINTAYIGKKNKYIYAAIGEPWPKAKGVVKLDISISETDRRDCIVATRIFGPNCFCSEPFFVAKDPNNVFAADEDDGYVVCYMHDENTRESSFLVMDAKSHNLEIVAVVKLPRRVPYGFHGIFVNEGLVFSEYLLSGLVPSVKEVNDEEPLFPAAILNLKAAYEIIIHGVYEDLWDPYTKEIRYIYAAIGNPWPKAKGVVKLDLSISEIDHRDCVVATQIFGPNCFCCEPFFVAKDPNNVFAADEDDGYVVCDMHNENTRESSLLVMDAKSHDLEIVAVVKLPRRVPYGFHGIFVKESDLNMLLKSAR